MGRYFLGIIIGVLWLHKGICGGLSDSDVFLILEAYSLEEVDDSYQYDDPIEGRGNEEVALIRSGFRSDRFGEFSYRVAPDEGIADLFFIVPRHFEDESGLASERIEEIQLDRFILGEEAAQEAVSEQNESIYSYSYIIDGVELDNGAIGFINGINNTFEEAMVHAERISQYAQGAKIYGVYNASHSPLRDILKCFLGHCRISLPPVRLLKNQWDQFIASHESESKFLQICHSGGAIFVFHALASVPKEIRKRIIVLAISPGAVIPKKLCFEAYNYASKRDVVPHLDAIGKIRYGDQLMLLEPDQGAMHFDHGLDSPTFQEIILFHVTKYLQEIEVIK